jgi:hypothetical protein
VGGLPRFFFDRTGKISQYHTLWENIKKGVEKQSGNWEKYFERWGMTALKDDVLKPRTGYSESELLRIPFEQILIRITKIIEEDVCKYHDSKDRERKAKEESKNKT